MAVAIGVAVPSFGATHETTLHTNFFYFGDIKEIFRAYTNASGKLVKHGKYRGWHGDGHLWHEMDYRDGQRHGTITAFHHNGQKSYEAIFVDDLLHGTETMWDRDGKVVSRGARRKGWNWTGSFVEKSTHSIGGPGDENIEHRVVEYREGKRLPGDAKIVVDDGKKWKPAPGPPDYRRYLRWNRYPYEIRSSYPYLKRLPPWPEIPVLPKWMNSGESDAGEDVSYSQLVALVRSDFGHPARPPEGGMPYERKEYYREKRSRAWAEWWKTVGAEMETRLRTHGRKNAKAWKLVHDSQPLPDDRLTIPDEWVFRTTFRNGDYLGVTTETITLRRSRTDAALIRGIRRGTQAPLEWERWSRLTVEEADDFAFAVAYAIDHPWLLKPKNQNQGQLEGRRFGLYHPRFRYTLSDSLGNVWCNDDPWSWHGARGNEGSFMEAHGLGSVCLLLWRCFPDNSSGKEAAPGRWVAIRGTNSTVVGMVVEDLKMRGEILDVLDYSQRLRDAMAAMEQFGTRNDISAINQFETELPARFGEVATIVEQDPNGHFVRAEVKRLLEEAAKAKAAILKRDSRPLGRLWRIETLIGMLVVGLFYLRWTRMRRRAT